MVLSPTPLQNCFKPPDEPPEPTTGVLNCGKVLPNSSATILAYGSTVEEPAIWMVSRAACAVVTAVAPVTANAKADRKSTRLNSSHVKISYAVFCLKKKKDIQQG